MTNDSEVQENPRKDVVGGSVNAEEKALIEAARARAGIKTMSEYVRETLLERSRRILTPKRQGEAPAPDRAPDARAA